MHTNAILKGGPMVVLALAGITAGLAARAAHSQPRPTSTDVAGQCEDHDGDKYGAGCASGPDCNDADARVHPGAIESCNSRDDDCDGTVDEACPHARPNATPVAVPASTFAMGNSGGPADERPAHRVRLGAFTIDRYEVTNARYRGCVQAGACSAPRLVGSHLRAHYFDDGAFDDYPVIFVDQRQAAAFCTFAGGRLPTEAEWELAARGTDGRTYPWGEAAPDCTRANMGGTASCAGDTDRVGQRPAGASPFGAMDMAGNVWEWTADWYDASYYRSSPSTSPQGPAQGTLKVMRGGCWESGADSLRTTCRKPELPGTWAYNVGFRCVYDAKVRAE